MSSFSTLGRSSSSMAVRMASIEVGGRSGFSTMGAILPIRGENRVFSNEVLAADCGILGKELESVSVAASAFSEYSAVAPALALTALSVYLRSALSALRNVGVLL